MAATDIRTRQEAPEGITFEGITDLWIASL